MVEFQELEPLEKLLNENYYKTINYDVHTPYDAVR